MHVFYFSDFKLWLDHMHLIFPVANFNAQ